MRSRLFFLFLLLCAVFPLAAQFTPQGFNYQSIVRESNGNPVTNQTVVLLFSIRSGAPNGPVAYSEKQTISTNEFGLVNLIVGQGGTPLQGDFTAINWGNGAKYLTVALETSPNVFDELGSSQLMSVPYALYAQNAANGGGGGDDWGLQTVQTGAALSGNGTAANPLNLAPQGADTGQVLKWNGSNWIPQDDIANTGTGGGTVTEVFTGTGLTGGPITTTGTVSLTNTGVTPGSYGSATEIPVITVDAQGRVTDVIKTNVQSGSVNIDGAAGIDVQQTGSDFVITNTGDTNASDDVTSASTADGDITGPFNNLQIKSNAVGSAEIAVNSVTEAKIANAAVTGAKLDDMNATPGQVLKWNGLLWTPSPDAGITAVGITAGAGISVTGTSPNFTIANSGDTNPADDLTAASTADGDVSGTFSNLQIKANAVGTTEIAGQAVTGAKIAQQGATNGQVLKWNGTTWAPQADDAGSTVVLPGPGIDIVPSGNTFTVINAGDLDPFDDITNNSQAGGDLSGTFSNLQLKPAVVTNADLANNSVGTTNIINGSITANKLNNMSAGVGQVLKFNGTAWAPAADNAGSDNWGTQTAVTDATLTGNGTNLTPLKIAQQGATNGQILKWNGSTWFPANEAGGDNWGTQTASVGPTLTGNGTAGSPLNLAQQGAGLGKVLKWNGSGWAPGDDEGDNWGIQAVWVGPALTGNGTFGSPVNLDQQGASPGQVLKWSGTAWTPGADAGGDNWGSQVVTTSTALTGNGTAGSPLGIAQQGAAPGQVLQWSGSAWTPASFSGDNWGAQVATTGSTLTGNGAGTPLNIAQQGAAPGEVLKWNGASWVPSGDAVGGTGDVYGGGTGISITGSSPNFVVNNTGDLDNTNEIQSMSLAGNQLSLSLGGGTVALPDYTAGTGISLTGTAPTFTIINTGDLSNTNEFQTLNLAGNQLTILPNGNSVTLPVANNYTAGTGISITGLAPNFTINNTGDTDNNPTNELQTISIAGNDVSLSNGGGTITLPTGNSYTAGTGISITGTAPNFIVNNTGDADNNATNELQTLSLTGTILEISGSGSSVDLSAIGGGGSDDWQLDNNNIFNTNTESVLIGTNASSSGKLQVVNGTGNGEGASIINKGSAPAVFGQNEDDGPGALFTSGSGPALLTRDGNVGIHTNTPAYRLDVDGDGHFATALPTPQLTVEQSGSDFARMMLKNSGAGGWTLAGRGGASPLFSLDFGPVASLLPILTANGNGNVAIGGVNNGPSALKVFHNDIALSLENVTNGNHWDFQVNAFGNLVLYNNQLGPGIPAGTFNATTGIYLPSDRRLKKEIAAIPMGILDKIMQLEPVSYHYMVEKETAKRSLGFIAQDVQTLFPELVGESQTRDGSDSYLSLNYAGFGILAVKAIQEQQQQIEALKAENEALRKRMETFEVRLQRLEQSDKK